MRNASIRITENTREALRVLAHLHGYPTMVEYLEALIGKAWLAYFDHEVPDNIRPEDYQVEPVLEIPVI